MNACGSVTLAVVAAALLSGCAYPNQFRNVRAVSVHAVLVGEDVRLPHINGQPTSFWRFRERFRIPPGPTTVRVISGHLGEVEFPLLQFEAEAGQTYSIQRKCGGGSDSIILRESLERVVVELERRVTP